MESKHKKKQKATKSIRFDLKEGKLPNGFKPIVMSNVEEFLRSQGDIDTQELLDIIHKYK